MFRVVIPARFGSTRLPGKVLLPLAGKAMVRWVYERACASAAHEVIIATDDRRIAEAAEHFGAEIAMTSSTHASGTDRIAEVARARRWAEQDIVVNVQADEPLLPSALIGQVAGLLERPEVRLVTLTGPGGVGKTRLAVAVGERLRDRFGAGIAFVPLDSVTDSGQVLAAWRRQHAIAIRFQRELEHG